MERQNWDSHAFLKNLNQQMLNLYPKIPQIFGLQAPFDILSVKNAFRKKINSLALNDKINANLAYEYLLSPKRFSSFDKENVNTFIPFEFSHHLVIIMNELEFLKDFLEKSRRKNYDDQDAFSKRTYLYLACKCGYIEIVRYLLQNGANPNYVQINESSALHAASFFGHFDVATLLMEAGADWRLKNAFGNLAENEAATKKF